MSNWARAGRGLGSLRPQTGLSPGVATKRTDRGRAAVIRRQARLRGTQPAAAMAARDTACSCGMGRRQGICVAAAQERQ